MVRHLKRFNLIYLQMSAHLSWCCPVEVHCADKKLKFDDCQDTSSFKFKMSTLKPGEEKYDVDHMAEMVQDDSIYSSHSQRGDNLQSFLFN